MYTSRNKSCPLKEGNTYINKLCRKRKKIKEFLNKDKYTTPTVCLFFRDLVIRREKKRYWAPLRSNRSCQQQRKSVTGKRRCNEGYD